MGAYIIRRLLALIPVLIGVSFLTFAISQVTPGDPVVLMLGNYATPERVAELRQQLGLNDPFLVQFGRYIWNAAHGNLGMSIRGQTPVSQEILQRFPSTLQLTVAAMIFAAVAGVTAGILAATAKSKIIDNLTMVVSLTGLSVPSFWLAIILIIIFGIKLRWVSVTGGSGIKDLILPAFCLGIGPAAVLARLTRSCLLEVLREDYVRTARAKGLAERVVMFRHVLRNAMIPVVTVMSLQVGGMLGGAVFIESVFARPGLGRFEINAIGARDYPQIQGGVLFIAAVYVLVNLGADLLYGFLDPRIRFD
jgi:peptide/nickel transport system permease protein